MSAHAYQTPYVFPTVGDFRDRIVSSKVVVEGPFSVVSVEGDPAYGPQPDQPGAYSIQQNVCAKDHFYQNVLNQNPAMGLIWHLECFKRRADGTFPSSGQFYRSTDAAGTVPSTSPWGTTIPASVDLRKGDCTIELTAEDDGTTIGFGVIITQASTGAIVYVGTPATVETADTTAAQWYDPLTVASCVPVGLTSGMKALFSGASFLVAHDAGLPLSVGGTYLGSDGITPYTDPFPPLCTSTDEASNLTFPAVDRSTDHGMGVLMVNGHNESIYVSGDGVLYWEMAGASLVQFGFIPHGVDPAPPNAGFQVVQTELGGRGTYVLTPGSEDYIGNQFDAYAYDTSSNGPSGYSQPVIINISDALQFRGTA